MFTRLYYRAMAAAMSSQINSLNLVVKNAAGQDYSLTSVDALANYADRSYFRSGLINFGKLAKNTLASGSFLEFGTGDTPVTLDDYQLAGEHITTYTASYNYQFNDDATEVTYLYTITNTGSSTFTIKEIGLYSYYSNKSSSGLIMREVLDSPVTIEPGGVGQVTLTLKINVPEA